VPAAVVRKISETIIDFGERLVGQLDPGQTEETVHTTFEIVITIWNAYVMATPRWGQPRFLADLQDRLRDPQMPPELIEAHGLLAERRTKHFAKDLRAVGEWSVYQDGSGWHLRCETRAPKALK